MVRGNWIPTHRRMKLNPSITLKKKTNFKWIKNGKLEILKQLEENISGTRQDTGIGKNFLKRDPFV